MKPRRRLFGWLTAVSLLILLVAGLLGNGPFAGASVVYAASKPKSLPAHLTYQQFLHLSHQATAGRKPFQWYQPTTPSPMSKQEQAFAKTPRTLPPSAEPPTMRSITQTLSAAFLVGAPGTPPLTLVSSDRRLEVQIPAGAFDLSHARVSGTNQGHTRTPRTGSAVATPTATLPTTIGPTATPTATLTPPTTATASPRGPPPAITGPLTLRISEQHGQFVGEMNQLGQYQWQIVDAHQRLVSGITLRHPLTIRYRYQPSVLTGLDLDPGEMFFNWPDLAAADRAAHRSTTQDAAHFTNDTATDTLTAHIGVLDNGPFVVSGDPQNQSPPTPNEASVSGNTGQASYSYPLQLAPAPDGFAPQLALSYSSGNTNERQNVTSPAGDVGDGWTLALGAITAAVYPSSSSGGSATWYSISGVDGISDRLVPDPSHSGWYLTQHLSYLRIQQVTANNEPCFHVWDQSDTYYQFGCTPDSLQYHYASNTLSLYQWDLNEIVAPNDGSTSTFKNIVVKYFQDCGSQTGACPQASNASGSDAIRDAAIEQIQYGIGSQPGVVSTASGAVDFYYWAPTAPSGVSQWAIPYTTSFNGQSYACDGNPPEDTHNMRCDDPQPDADDPGSAPPPTMMSTLTLLSVTSYVGNDSGTGSFPAYQYQFNYTDTPLSECVDPLSQVQETCAGDHVLDSVTPFVYKHGAANKLQPLLLDYTTLQDGYYDTTQTVPGGDHYDIKTNWMYLADEYDSNTGVGEHLDYNTAYNNSHGTPADIVNGVVIDNRLDPLFCPNHLGGSLDCWNYGTKQFAYPDDRAWTTQVVIDRKSFGVDSSAMSQAETTYAYVMRFTDDNDPNMCPDDGTGDTNCPGDNWWPKGDNDWQDYYHGQFQGFNFVNTVSPAGELTQDNYFSTDGWKSSSNFPNNAFAGDLTEEDVYQGNSTSAPLLYDLTNNYGGLNKTTPPCDSSVTGPYDPCEPIIYSSVVTTYNGSTSPNPPTETTSYYYDDYNPPGSQQSSWALSISGNYHHLLEETTTGSNTNENSASNTITQVWTYTTTDSGYNPSGWYFYDVNKLAHSEIDDSANPMRKWDCQAFTYDEGSGSPTPEAGWPTTVNTYTSAGCNPPPGTYGTPITTSYTGYDAIGDAVATVDPLAQANQSFYGGTGLSGENGCSLNTAPAFMSSAWSKSRYTTCITYDPTYNALPTTTTNAFSQTASTSYDAQMGELPKAVTDPNGQATSYNYSYDSSGNRTVQVTEPNPQNAYTSQSETNSSCASSIPSGATTPCFEIDSNEAAYPTAITETFYDGQGRQVETRAPGPTSGDDTIQFIVYNDQAHTSFTSVPFEVTAGSGWLDPATAKDKNGHTPAGTMTYYDALGRVVAVDDPIFTKGTGIWCPSINADATACSVYKLDSPQGSSELYDTEKDIDPNNHVMEAFTDAMGRTAAIQEYSGTNGNGLTAIQQISYQYDALAQPTQVTTIDLAPQSGQTVSSVTATMSYDDLGRLTQLVDPDRGTHNYTYDPDGNVLNDTSGSRTIGYNDDLLGRIGCVQDGTAASDADGSCTSGTNVLVLNTYDTTEIGTQGTNDFPIGRLTKSQATTYYPEGGSLQSTEKYQYDQRGRVTTEQLKFNLPNSWNLTLPTYQLTELYTDADQPLTTQTSTLSPNGNGYTFSEVYDQTLGVLTGLSSTTNVTTADLASVGYTVNALLGSLNFNTSGGVGSSLATESFSYDGDLRPTEESATWQSGSGQSGTFFDNA